jgi:hypothetical protein
MSEAGAVVAAFELCPYSARQSRTFIATQNAVVAATSPHLVKPEMATARQSRNGVESLNS